MMHKDLAEFNQTQHVEFKEDKKPKRITVIFNTTKIEAESYTSFEMMGFLTIYSKPKDGIQKKYIVPRNQVMIIEEYEDE
jgi:hypothetical protein